MSLNRRELLLSAVAVAVVPVIPLPAFSAEPLVAASNTMIMPSMMAKEALMAFKHNLSAKPHSEHREEL